MANEIEKIEQINSIKDLSVEKLINTKNLIDTAEVIVKSIEVNVTEDNIDEYKRYATELNKAATSINGNAIVWEKEQSADIKKARKRVNILPETMKEKRQEILQEIGLFDEKEKHQRLVKFQLFYEQQIADKVTFDFINFTDHIYNDKMVTKGAFTPKGEIKKEYKDAVIARINKYVNDYAAIESVDDDYKAQAFIDYKTANTPTYLDISAVLAKVAQVKKLKEEQQEIANAVEEVEKKVIEEKVEQATAAAKATAEVTGHKIETKVTEIKSNISNDKTHQTFNVTIPNDDVEKFVDFCRKQGYQIKKGE